MKIYKYKSLLKLEDKELEHFYQIVLENQIWCGNPANFNDENEFLFRIDYTPSINTIGLPASIISKYKSNPLFLPMMSSTFVVDNGRLEKIASPIIEDISIKCRKELGVTCFSKLRDDSLLWNRYGGCENGVCIEIEINDELIDKEYFHVNYVPKKIYHIDDFLKSVLEDPYVNYRSILLTKTLDWEPESEVRLISNKQSVKRNLKGSIKEIIIGKNVKLEIGNDIHSRIGTYCNENKIQITWANKLMDLNECQRCSF
ncbi:hypothetical protein BMS3Abin15_00184 [bacterium BMS3Abin15]|nr:hypothetical protein BMS3Abin15_00184 [bacterium BMS3Abin15]